jgi:hypothetical protein
VGEEDDAADNARHVLLVGDLVRMAVLMVERSEEQLLLAMNERWMRGILPGQGFVQRDHRPSAVSRGRTEHCQIAVFPVLWLYFPH